MIRIFLADDHTLFREGLKKIVAGTSDIIVSGEAGNGNEILSKLREQKTDVLVLDISMPGKDGLEVLKQVKTLQPQLPVLILSMFPEEQYATRVLKAGASGYLTKESAPDVLIMAVRKAARGERYISPSLADLLAADLSANKGKLPHERLSDREYQIMCLMATGKRMKEIAVALSLSPTTISTYRSRILDKMEMSSNAELTLYASKNSLIN
jgi:two-component system, NarL family, invasion response regulator UvrY